MSGKEAARSDASIATRLRDWITQLDQSDRLLILLRYADQLSIPEISCLTHIAETDVDARLRMLKDRCAERVGSAVALV